MKDVTGTGTEKALTLNVNSNELSVKDLQGQVAKVQSIMKSVMKDGVHYGTVPGIPQKFLYKAGAEKLSMTFRLIPSYKVDKTIHEGGHITYDITCVLSHGPSLSFMGEGLGTCSTLEKKYRYRNEDIPTGVEVPGAWWNSRKIENLPKILRNSNVEPMTAAQMKKQGLTIATGKVNGRQEIVYRKKVENPDIADQYNTVIKMAKKRSLVDAIITALSVGDMFSQDPDAVNGIEPEEEKKEEEEKAEVKKPAARKRAPRKA